MKIKLKMNVAMLCSGMFFACSPGWADATAPVPAPAVTPTATAPVTTATTAPALSTAPIDEPLPEFKDPYEGFNRLMFAFNDKLDKFIMKPIARVYNAIMPRPLNEGIHNFYMNINNLPTIANDVLQANFFQAANDSWRLVINTTVGVGGLFDIAERMKLKPYTNDFGLTLAKWGYANSNYLVLPFFGPNTLRDGLGLPVDYFAFSVYPYIQPIKTRYIVYGVGVVDRRAQLLQFQSVMEEATLDKYVFMRNAYMQRRAYQIDNNEHRGYEDQANEQPLPNPVSG